MFVVWRVGGSQTLFKVQSQGDLIKFFFRVIEWHLGLGSLWLAFPLGYHMDIICYVRAVF